MRYIPTTPSERAAMLAAIGVSSVDELFADIPANLRVKGELELPPAMAEAQVLAHMRQLAGCNANLDEYACFMGGGIYDRLIPAALPALVNRSEFVTAYTPYQAEISQGVLQSIYEFQSLICELTGMDVANASVYDGATACAEAAIMACGQTNRSLVLLAEGVHPEYRQVIQTYLQPQGLQVATVPLRSGQLDKAELAQMLFGEVAALVVQQPNFFGCLEEMQELSDAVHAAGGLFVAVVEPISLGLLAPPGSYSADIAVGEGQSLGNAPSFGGPALGFMATRQKFVRRLPGRIVGATVDGVGKLGYVLTLQTREQHIRRERAVSNICSNQALNALVATVYLSLLGKEGLREAAWLSWQKAHYAQTQLVEVAGCRPVFKAPFFQEFTLYTGHSPQELNTRLLKEKIIGGLPLEQFGSQYTDMTLFCVTEARTKEEIDRLVQVVQAG